MKKKYESPAVLVVKLHHEMLICQSVSVSNQPVIEPEDIGFVKLINNGEWFMNGSNPIINY